MRLHIGVCVHVYISKYMISIVPLQNALTIGFILHPWLRTLTVSMFTALNEALFVSSGLLGKEWVASQQ